MRTDAVTLFYYDGKITVIYSAGESKDVMFSESTETNVLYRWAIDIAADSNDKVFAVRGLDILDENGRFRYDFVLYVFDENYNIKRVSV